MILQAEPRFSQIILGKSLKVLQEGHAFIKCTVFSNAAQYIGQAHTLPQTVSYHIVLTLQNIQKCGVSHSISLYFDDSQSDKHRIKYGEGFSITMKMQEIIN